MQAYVELKSQMYFNTKTSWLGLGSEVNWHRDFICASTHRRLLHHLCSFLFIMTNDDCLLRPLQQGIFIGRLLSNSGKFSVCQLLSAISSKIHESNRSNKYNLTGDKFRHCLSQQTS